MGRGEQDDQRSRPVADGGAKRSVVNECRKLGAEER